MHHRTPGDRSVYACSPVQVPSMRFAVIIPLSVIKQKRPFYVLFFKTSSLSWQQKVKPFQILMKQEMMVVAVASAAPYANHLHLTQIDR